ncbi:ABC transporter ATP-binding protein [Streptacidiphilus sp. PB12-B1b]|uniref:ABC transporter ATP-binding protein n=1 Tax=Streptacidiphilus sp. PB12-B1b TaxID=2705012 RepID=UPI0015F8D70E|nr:ABC transporter ATP-binding protein [Streptacidiphilus sp. PB12-B1b]QMU79109.1 ABC transporter ATP-binding protein [Streptacidiphilus sp. PB12-B1b]
MSDRATLTDRHPSQKETDVDAETLDTVAADPGSPTAGDARTEDPTAPAAAAAVPAAAPENAPPAEGEDIPVPPGAPRALLGSLLGPHRTRVIIAVLMIGLQQAALQVGPLLVSVAIDRAIPALRAHDWGPLIALTSAYLGCAALATLLQRAYIRLSGRINQDILLDMRQRIFRHAQLLSLDFHERYTSGRIISRATSDVDAVRELLNEGMEELLSMALQILYISALLIYLDWRLGLVSIASFIPVMLLQRAYRRRSQGIYRLSRTAAATVIVRFTETMNGIRPVQAFRREEANEAAFGEVNAAYTKSNADSMLSMARFVAGSRATANVWITGMVLWSAYLVSTRSLELGVLAAFVLYLRRLYDPIDQLAMFVNSYQSAAAALEKIAGLLAHEPSVPEASEPTRLPVRPEGAQAGREILFADVDFTYRTGKQVLPRFDLRIPAGQSVAVVGATGAGKSTLAKLLARFYDPSGGRVLLDGVDLRELSTPDLRAGVVMVTQESFLFSGTVADNIAIGRPGAAREEVEAAAKAIGAHGFISELPDGYDTDVRKRGGRISAGQRQLVAFARALLADPSVLILDEATSSLDVPGERAVQEAMRTVLAGRTAVIIAHRLSTVEIADRVLVMEQGRIVEDGTPADLITGTGRFSRLHEAWRDSLV